MTDHIQTSLVIRFAGAVQQAIISAEIDARPAGLNGGNTDFVAGDSIGYLVFLSGAKITRQTATAGHIISAGNGQAEIEEILTFEATKTATATKPVSGGFSAQWIGLDGGPLSVTKPNLISAQKSTIGLASVSYQSAYQSYRLQGVPTAIDQVLIVIEAEPLS